MQCIIIIFKKKRLVYMHIVIYSSVFVAYQALKKNMILPGGSGSGGMSAHAHYIHRNN